MSKRSRMRRHAILTRDGARPPSDIIPDRMLASLRRRQTLASFDYQWGELPEGDAMLSDPWFRENVDRILVEELLCVERDWFRGRRVLDAGCGIGRWTLGFLRLGCDVTAVDFSPRALERLRA